jgi:HEPN domain-containing protein
MLKEDDCMGADETLAKQLLETAERDLNALKHMADTDAFDDAIFGFHAQQTVEKACKAWLHGLGQPHPFTHDLSLLLRRIEDAGGDVAAYWDLLDLTAYAVRFRYESLPTDGEPLEREALIADLEQLVTQVRLFLGT